MRNEKQCQLHRCFGNMPFPGLHRRISSGEVGIRSSPLFLTPIEAATVNVQDRRRQLSCKKSRIAQEDIGLFHTNHSRRHQKYCFRPHQLQRISFFVPKTFQSVGEKIVFEPTKSAVSLRIPSIPCPGVVSTFFLGIDSHQRTGLTTRPLVSFFRPLSN